MVQAHLHAAERVGQVVEPGQVDLGEVVDRHAVEAAHDVDGGLPPGLPAGLLEGGRVGDALRGQLLFGGVFGHPVGLFDLAWAVAGMGPVVARDGERRDLAAVGGDVEQDQGVGVVAALVAVSGVQLIEDRGR